MAGDFFKIRAIDWIIITLFSVGLILCYLGGAPWLMSILEYLGF